MITTLELLGRINDQVLKKVVCPVCLSTLYHVPINDERSDLICKTCNSTFFVIDGLPILLIEDENWQKKADEIRGEVLYNVKKIPPEVHIERNAFVDKNTRLFLDEAGIDLTGQEILAVGCSMAELLFYSSQSNCIVGLDIVPPLAQGCYRATLERNIQASWVCGDGECLPFEKESFDIVIIRQTLHHMLKYYSAVSEFFRVCRVGGLVIVVDEPFTAFDPADTSISYDDICQICKDISCRQDGKNLNVLNAIAEHSSDNKYILPGSSVKAIGFYHKLKSLVSSQSKAPLTEGSVKKDGKGEIDFDLLEKNRQLIGSDSSDPETLLADKYHVFSLPNCIQALKMHTTEFYLSWPRETAWTDNSEDTVKFCHGPNPNCDKPLLEKLVSAGNVSIAARKICKTRHFRNRQTIRSISFETLSRQLL